jgi:hypothetical protein
VYRFPSIFNIKPVLISEVVAIEKIFFKAAKVKDLFYCRGEKLIE